MKKIFVVVFSLFLVASLGAQERIVKRIEFFYENGNKWNDSVGDTLTGVAAGAASVDTIFFSALGPDKRAFETILVAVKKDTNLLASQQKTDTTLVRIFRGVGGFYNDAADTASVGAALNGGAYTATDVLGFVTDDFLFEINATAGNFPATSYKMVIDHSMMANTDSTAYRVRIVGIYNNE